MGIYGRKIDSRTEAVQQWLLELKAKCAEGEIAIALEQRRGPLFYQLCSHLQKIDLYPVYPQSLASFRQRFFSSRAKDDPVDSQLLEELVRTHGDRLRAYEPQPISERKTRPVLPPTPRSAGSSNPDRIEVDFYS
jgi:hypothetical protein